MDWRIFVAALAVCIAGARGQVGPFSMAGPYSVPITRAGVEAIGAKLGLDAEQMAGARMLHGGYRLQFLKATETAHADVEIAFTQGPNVVLRERVRVTQDFIDTVQKLEQGLMRDLRELCTHEQEARFGAVERARRRAKGGFFSIAAGAGVDLVRLIDEMEIERTPELEEILERWEREVEHLDRERDRAFREAIPQNLGGAGPERDVYLKRNIAELYSIATRRRDATRKSLRESEAVLAKDDFVRMRQRIQEESFPRIYAGSPLLKLANWLEQRGGLNQDQQRQVQGIRTEYEQESATINARWAVAAEAKQVAIADNYGRDDDPDDPSDAFYVIRKERQALDNRYRERLLALLTDAQRQAATDRISPSDPVPEYMADFGISKEAWAEFKERS